MIGPPVVAYTGGVPGLKATKPAKGQKIKQQHRRCALRLRSWRAGIAKHSNHAGGGRKLYSYRYSFNGFAAEFSRTHKQSLWLPILA